MEGESIMLVIENKFLDLLTVESHFHSHLWLQAAWPPCTYVYTRGITFRKNRTDMYNYCMRYKEIQISLSSSLSDRVQWSIKTFLHVDS